MRLDRVMIAAPKSGSGKTTITCALLQTFKDMGKKVVSYKCGPDYIDPMFHREVLHIPSKNLDTFFTDEKETKRLFLKHRTEEEFAVIEGVMGLYDGLGGIREEGSAYHLAKVTKTPIILVVDAKGMGRSVVPLIAGFLKYDREHLIKGVILNRMSKSYYEIIKPVIEEELHICVAGYFAHQPQLHIESRHLGLCLPTELQGIEEQLHIAAEELQKSVSMKQIIQIAESAEELEVCKRTESILEHPKAGCQKERPVIAAAKDEAFCFYYEDNLQMLQECGAKIEYFSLLHDTELPKGSSGILIGGGYPELFAEELSKNTGMLSEIKKAVEDGMPLVAECGGFMYLHTAIKDKDEKSHKMSEVIGAECHDTGKLVRFGYIELEEKQSNFLEAGTKIKGHEFHYFDSENNGSDCTAVKPATGKSYSCVISKENVWMGFPHLYYPSNPSFAYNFVKKANRYSDSKRR